MKMKTLRERIVEFYLDDKRRPMLMKELMNELGLASSARRLLRSAVYDLEKVGFLRRTNKNRLQLTSGIDWHVGQGVRFEDGPAMLSDSGEIFGLSRDVKGRRVLYGGPARLLVIRDKSQTFRGVLFRGEPDLFIPDEGEGEFAVTMTPAEANHLDRVEVILESGKARIIACYGMDRGGILDPLDVCDERGIPVEFPTVVTKAAKKQKADVKRELAHRTDLRHRLIYTIDGSDAKDLDDAISVEETQIGYRIGVHIADVTHFVKDEGPIDQEACYRGTSIYFPGMNVPMLPRHLSDQLCSLNPREDKLTLTVWIDLDRQGNVIGETAEKTVIRSQARLIYSDVSDLLEGRIESLADDVVGLEANLWLATEVASLLESGRRRRGALSFRNIKARVIAEDEVQILPEEKGIANRLIESFMVAANEAVARIAERHDLPFLYRVHPAPQPSRLDRLANYLEHRGFLLDLDDASPKEMQEILQEASTSGLATGTEQLLLEAMLPAFYSDAVIEHFGLASTGYAHFTSPIRRYPDLVNHRVIKMWIEGVLSGERREELEQRFPAIAARSSDRERIADAAECEVVDSYIEEWAKERIGTLFHGTVIGLNEGEILVQLPNGVTGSVYDGRVAMTEDGTASIEGRQVGYGEGMTVSIASIDDGIVFKPLFELREVSA